MTGTMKVIKQEKGFGFVTGDDGRDAFVHCSDVAPSLPFDSRLVNCRVEYDVEQAEKGLRAVRVRPAA